MAIDLSAREAKLAGLQHTDELYIGGVWVPPSSGRRLEIYSPADEIRRGAVAEAMEADVDRAVKAARAAFDHGPWPHTAPEERAAKLHQLADKVRERSEDFSRAWSLQVGMPLWQSRLVTILQASLIDFFARSTTMSAFEELRPTDPKAAELFEDRAHGAPPYVCMVVREPVGVAAAIVPWNAPLPTLLVKVVPALAAGCTVIAKPAPETPLEALLLAECLDELGLPEGVFSVLPAGREVSDYLIRQPGIDKVSFTGSTAVGLHIASVCGQRSARVTTELGGKSAAIILDDAKIETVVGGVLPNLIGLAGQQCAAFSRILVPRRRHDEIVDALAAAMRQITVGDPFDDSIMMGPLVAKRQLDRVCGLLESAHREGAKLVIGGGRPSHLEKGWFVEPTLFTGVDNDMTIAREEIFGPVGSIISYDDPEEAIAIANDSKYGLSGGVFTEDTDRAYAVARRIRVGNFAQNGRVIDFTLPYGGFKQSGIGREGGIEGIYGFTELKSVYLPRPPAHFAPTA